MPTANAFVADGRNGLSIIERKQRVAQRLGAQGVRVEFAPAQGVACDSRSGYTVCAKTEAMTVETSATGCFKPDRIVRRIERLLALAQS